MMVDRARALTIAGVTLGLAALLGLFLVLTGGEEPDVVLPKERDAAPIAPSQTPEADGVAAGAADGPLPPPAETGTREEAAPAPERPLSERTLPQKPRAQPSVGDDDGPPPVQAAPPTSSAPAAAVVFCFPGVVPTPDACADREVVLSLADEEIGVATPGGTTQALSVELSDPAGRQAPRMASTCEQFLSLKANDWGALTSAGLRREAEMNRFCGLIAMARRAVPGRGGLTALTEADLESVPDDEWPSLGEGEVTNPIVLDTPNDPRAWFVQADRVEFTVRDVAAADFDGDGRNEVLVYTTLAAADGTARGGGYALAKRSGETVRFSPANLY